jgi:hypothetical protein
MSRSTSGSTVNRPPTLSCISLLRTPASGSRRKSRRSSSTRPAKWTALPRASTKGPDWDSQSPRAWSVCWEAESGSKATRTRKRIPLHGAAHGRAVFIPRSWNFRSLHGGSARSFAETGHEVEVVADGYEASGHAGAAVADSDGYSNAAYGRSRSYNPSLPFGGALRPAYSDSRPSQLTRWRATSAVCFEVGIDDCSRRARRAAGPRRQTPPALPPRSGTRDTDRSDGNRRPNPRPPWSR